MDEEPEAPREVRAAAGVIGAESLALLAAAIILVIKTAAGHPHSVAGALLGAALALAGAVVLAVGARGLIRLQPASRTPIVVLQLLALPVSYSLAFQAHRVAYGAPMLLAALAVLYLLFTPPARTALDRAPRD